jgi:hypothetical protein
VAQTPEIQKKVEKKLGELKKEKSALEDLLELALKNHPDIPVAEAKLRDAELALYRTRVQILEKVTNLYYEIKAARAAADEAKSRAERDQALYNKAGISAAELSASLAAREKFQSDFERVAAQMEFLVGKHNSKAASSIRTELHIDGLRNFDTGFLTKPLASSRLHDTGFIAAPLGEKIRKAMDAPYDSGPNEVALPASDLLHVLRKHAKGINIVDKVANPDVEAKLLFKESIPLGALFQWAEDQLSWRFIIRDYGIVAIDRDTVPPGAVLLVDFWRKGPPPTAAP